MEKRDLQTVVDAALRRMENEGASAKQLKEYRQTGFGAIRRHFLSTQQSDFSANVIDSFVLQTRSDWENGIVSYGKWHLVCRGGELLKHFVRSGGIEMPALRPWNPILQKTSQSVELDTPTSEQLADPDNLFALIWRVRQQLFKKGLTESAVHHYIAEGFSVILRRHINCGLECYSESLASEMVSQKREQYESVC